MKKTIPILLILLFSVLLLTACQSTGEDTETEPSGSESDTQEIVVPESVITKADLSSYKIIIGNRSKALTEAGDRLSAALYKCTGKVINVIVAGTWQDKPSDKEILLGLSNRQETIDAHRTLTFREKGWRMDGSKLLIYGGTDEMAAQAAEALCERLNEGEVIYSSQNDTFFADSTVYEIDRNDFRIGNFALNDCYMAYPVKEDGIVSVCSAYTARALGEMTGAGLLSASYTKESELPGAPVFLVPTDWQKTPSGETCSLGEAWYRVTGTGENTRIELRGDSYLSVGNAAKAYVRDYAAGKSVGDGTVRQVSDGTQFIGTPPLTGKEIPVGSLTLCGLDIGAYSIVYGADACEKEILAANELAKYLEKATGRKLPVIPDTESAAHEIAVGITNRDTDKVKARRAQLRNDGIVYYIEDGRLYLTSHTDAGQFYAVYHFLEDYLGCIFLYNGIEVIREADAIEIPADLDYSYSSPLFYRYTDWFYNTDQNRKMGINATEDIMYEIVLGCHSMGRLSAVSGGYGSNTPNPCLTDDAVYEEMLAIVRGALVENPGCRVISVQQIDSYDPCQCENCQKLADELGNYSDVLITFINRLADDIKDDYPDVTIVTFAYLWSQTPPVTTVARDNVAIQFCTIKADFNVPLNDPHSEANRQTSRDIEGWKDFCGKAYYWDYTTNYPQVSRPFTDLFTIWENARFMADNGAMGIYEEGVYFMDICGEFHHLRGWLLSKLLWNPYMTWEEYSDLMDLYLEYYYGAGWRYIRYYIDCMNTEQYGSMSTFADRFTCHYIDKYTMLECFDRAIKAAEDETTRNRCRTSSVQVYVYDMDELSDDAIKLLEGIQPLNGEARTWDSYRDFLKQHPGLQPDESDPETALWREDFYKVYNQTENR